MNGRLGSCVQIFLGGWGCSGIAGLGIAMRHNQSRLQESSSAKESVGVNWKGRMVRGKRQDSRLFQE